MDSLSKTIQSSINFVGEILVGKSLKSKMLVHKKMTNFTKTTIFSRQKTFCRIKYLPTIFCRQEGKGSTLFITRKWRRPVSKEIRRCAMIARLKTRKFPRGARSSIEYYPNKQNEMEVHTFFFIRIQFIRILRLRFGTKFFRK